MVTGAQIRSARAALAWTAQELADRAGVSMKTIVRLETVDGVPPSRSETLNDIQMAFESAGIEFIGSPTDGPGIRIRRRSTTVD